MKTYVLIGVLCVAVVLVLWFFLGGKSTASITNYPPKNEKIVAFGDSLVFGQGSTKGNDFISVLGTKLGRKIENLGVSGNTTTDGVARMDSVVKLDPGIVILLLGGNDYLRRQDEAITQKNLETLIETFQANGAVVVLLGVRGGVLRDGREAMYKSLSEKYGTLYVDDVLSGILLKPELMFDGIHPNDAGYAIIAERLYEVFIENEL